MKKLSTTQRILAFIGMFLFLLAIAWIGYDEESGVENVPVSASIIEIVEQGEKKIVENNKDGYKVSIPRDWRIDKDKTQFYTPETLEEGGMKISCNSTKQQVKNLDEKRKQVLQNLNDVYGNEIEIITDRKIDTPIEGLEIETKTYFGNNLNVYFLKNNKEYSCSFYFDQADKEKHQEIREEFMSNLKFYE